ncbi:hypothetical protein OIU77_014732 [Salix suchowensis]|uniref:Uncharacterized protein n=1 Tax=Salix suchowensis TaxID=1278906 RepID=A0ABQ8ZYW4_9ROSI|nr:hypothetical protein OIU77_014732 [Salix suchowensis]
MIDAIDLSCCPCCHFGAQMPNAFDTDKRFSLFSLDDDTVSRDLVNGYDL